MVNDLKECAKFIPKTRRLELFNCLYNEFNNDAVEVARQMGITTRRVYFYLPNRRNEVRNYPNDVTTYLILKALHKKNPDQAITFLSHICDEANKRKTSIILGDLKNKLSNLYDIML